ncbi:MAG: precorrin-2 C(20)-methyltransferase [Deltaproteobacteria bacterium]|nr:precorrin-2 C(20)-methyltransferase [Candidatus Anaeroferrophillacea bacterium]
MNEANPISTVTGDDSPALTATNTAPKPAASDAARNSIGAGKTTSGILYGVGVGPGDPGLLTLKAAAILRAADIIFDIVGPQSTLSVSARVVDTVDNRRGRRENLLFSMSTDPAVRAEYVEKAALRVAEVLRQGLTAAVATIGDPLIYSTFGYLRRAVLELLPGVRVEIVPGITSFQAAAATRGTALVEDREVLTVIPAWDREANDHQVLEHADTAVLLKTYRSREAALKALDRHMPEARLLYAARLGLPGETVADDRETIDRLPPEYLSLLVARRRWRR